MHPANCAATVPVLVHLCSRQIVYSAAPFLHHRARFSSKKQHSISHRTHLLTSAVVTSHGALLARTLQHENRHEGAMSMRCTRLSCALLRRKT